VKSSGSSVYLKVEEQNSIKKDFGPREEYKNTVDGGSSLAISVLGRGVPGPARRSLREDRERRSSLEAVERGPTGEDSTAPRKTSLYYNCSVSLSWGSNRSYGHVGFFQPGRVRTTL